jgi:hypothetical protein
MYSNEATYTPIDLIILMNDGPSSFFISPVIICKINLSTFTLQYCTLRGATYYSRIACFLQDEPILELPCPSDITIPDDFFPI